MLESFDHILHLDFDWLFLHYGMAIYIILFSVIFIETGLVVMPYLPGDSLLFTAGLFARSGHLNLSYLLVLLFIAAVLGDNCNYWIGRKLGLKICTLKVKGKLLVKREHLHKTHLFFKNHGTKAIIMARFVPIVRTFSPFAAGIAEMDYRTFFSFDILGGVLWVGGLTIAGYLLGEIDLIRNHIDLVCLVIIFISIMPIFLSYFKSKKTKSTA